MSNDLKFVTGRTCHFQNVEHPTKFSKRGGLAGSQFLEGDCWERGSDFFHGGLQFLHKK